MVARINLMELAEKRVDLLLNALQQTEKLAKLVLNETVEEELMHAKYQSLRELRDQVKICLMLLHLTRLRINLAVNKAERQLQRENNEHMHAYEKFKNSLQNLLEDLHDVLKTASSLKEFKNEDYKELVELLKLTQEAVNEVSNFISKLNSQA